MRRDGRFHVRPGANRAGAGTTCGGSENGGVGLGGRRGRSTGGALGCSRTRGRGRRAAERDRGHQRRREEKRARWSREMHQPAPNTGQRSCPGAPGAARRPNENRGAGTGLQRRTVHRAQEPATGDPEAGSTSQPRDREHRKRHGDMLKHFAGIGDGARKTAEAYNAAVKSYKARAEPQARRLDREDRNGPGRRSTPWTSRTRRGRDNNERREHRERREETAPSRRGRALRTSEPKQSGRRS